MTTPIEEQQPETVVYCGRPLSECFCPDAHHPPVPVETEPMSESGGAPDVERLKMADDLEREASSEEQCDVYSETVVLTMRKAAALLRRPAVAAPAVEQTVETEPDDEYDDRSAIRMALEKSATYRKAYESAPPGGMALVHRGGAWRDEHGRVWEPRTSPESAPRAVSGVPALEALERLTRGITSYTAWMDYANDIDCVRTALGGSTGGSR